MRNSNCLNNTAKNGRGGCARIAGYGNSTIDGSHFRDNCAEQSGGALYYYNKRLGESEEPATHIVSSSDFIGNEVKVSESAGGAVSIISSGMYSFNDVEFRNNTAGDVGGALYLAEYPYFEFRRRLRLANVKPHGRPMESVSSFRRQLEVPTAEPTTDEPTSEPSAAPSITPTSRPSTTPTTRPSSDPSTQPSRLPSASPSDAPSNQPSVSAALFEAHFVSCKFTDNVARGEEFFLPAGRDIFVDEDYFNECDGPCLNYIEVNCDDSTEFIDACNTTDFTSTIWQYEPLDICTNSIRDENKTCIGDSCETDTCDDKYLIPTSATCSVVPDFGDICCIENGKACLGDDVVPFEKCCGNNYCDGGFCVEIPS